MRRQRWAGMDTQARAALLHRGLDDIFDPALRRSIGELIDDVREHGDAAVEPALGSLGEARDAEVADPALLGERGRAEALLGQVDERGAELEARGLRAVPGERLDVVDAREREVRLPRTLLALMEGVTLGLGGAVLQGGAKAQALRFAAGRRRALASTMLSTVITSTLTRARLVWFTTRAPASLIWT